MISSKHVLILLYKIKTQFCMNIFTPCTYQMVPAPVIALGDLDYHTCVLRFIVSVGQNNKKCSTEVYGRHK